MWKQGSVNKVWRKRYFILSQACLAYWDSVPSRPAASSGLAGSNNAPSASVSHPPRGLIPLENCEVEEEADKTTGYRFSFIIFTALDRDYVLRCSAEDEVLAWLVCIKRAVIAANKKVRRRVPCASPIGHSNEILAASETKSRKGQAQAMVLCSATTQQKDFRCCRQEFGAVCTFTSSARLQ